MHSFTALYEHFFSEFIEEGRIRTFDTGASRYNGLANLSPKSADLVIALTEQVVARDQLTTLMVTHSMHQAASLGDRLIDRLIMMHRGHIIHAFSRR
jgi:hypothetical protein